MAFSLADLQTGHLSLEFEEADLPRLIVAIHAMFGTVTQIEHAMAGEVFFAGDRFIHQNEWDECCIISTSSNGNDCLMRLHAELTRPAGSTG